MLYKKYPVALFSIILLFNSYLSAENAASKQWQQLQKQQGMIVAYFKSGGSPTKSRSYSKYYRVLIKVNKQQSYQVQDFYTATKGKYIDPVTLTNIEDIDKWQPKSAEGRITHWDEKGNKVSEGHLQQGQLEGIYLRWYQTGQLKTQSYYKKGRLNGKYTAWYPSGEKERQLYYVEDKIQGIVQKWYKSGQLVYQANYEQDEEQGAVYSWYENGKLASQYTSVKGNREGVSRVGITMVS